MSASAAAATSETRVNARSLPSEDGRSHPAMRAVTMVALGALAWVPVVAAGRLILS